MKYLLDTNVCIQFITGRSISVKENIENNQLSDMYICSVVRGELEYGARKSNNPEKTLSVLDSFLSNFPEIEYNTIAAKEYGIIRADLENKGIPIGPYDMQIAAIAMANNLIVVTHNLQEFQRIPNIKIEDWE